MKEKRVFDWKILAISVLAVGLVLCFVRIDTLQNEKERLDGQMAACLSDIRNLQGEINAIYANVDEQLREQGSLLSGVEYTFGTLNAERATVAMTLSVVPKTLTEDMRVTVSLDGRTTELTRNGNLFRGTLDVGLFVEYGQVPLLTMETEAGISTEYLEDADVSYLFSRQLPSLSAKLSGKSTHSGETLNGNWQLSVNGLSAESGVSFTSFALVTEVNGREVAREDITEALRQSNGSYSGSYRKAFTVSADDRLSVYAVAEDSLGYVHKTLAYHWQRSESGAIAETEYGGERIYDKSGALLFGAKE